MRMLGNRMHHVRLVTRMAQATQTDLVSSVSAGDLCQRDWADMVETCRSCGWADACPDWLDANTCAVNAPDTCPNRIRFTTLKAMAELRETEDA